MHTSFLDVPPILQSKRPPKLDGLFVIKCQILHHVVRFFCNFVMSKLVGLVVLWTATVGAFLCQETGKRATAMLTNSCGTTHRAEFFACFGKEVARLVVALGGCLFQPLDCAFHVLRNTFAIVVAQSQVVLRFGVALVCRHCVKFHCFALVFATAQVKVVFKT